MSPPVPSPVGPSQRDGEYFNMAAFQAKTPGTLGGEGRNSMVGPHWRHLDFSLIKVFPVRESLHVEFRAEVFTS